MQIGTINQTVNDSRLWSIGYQRWLNPGETLTDVVYSVDSGAAVITTPNPPLDSAHLVAFFFLNGGTLGSQFNILVQVQTSFGQTRNDTINVTVGPVGSAPSSSGIVVLSVAGPPGPVGPTGGAGFSGITSGVTPLLGGATGQLLYDPGTGVLQEITTVAYATGASGGSIKISTNNIGQTSTDGLVLQNIVGATLGAQQWSPRVHWTGQAYKSNPTAGSQTIDWIMELQTVQASNTPGGSLIFSYQQNGAGFNQIWRFDSFNGALTCASNSCSGINLGGSAAGISFNRSAGNPIIAFGGAGTNYFAMATTANDVASLGYSTSSLGGTYTPVIQWGDLTTSPINLIPGTSSGVVQHGAADGATGPVAQTLQVQSATGANNVTGATFTIKGSKSTGFAPGGSIAFQVTPAGPTGTVQNTPVTALMLYPPSGTGQQPSVVVGATGLATTATDGFLYVAAGAGAPTGVPTTQNGGNAIPMYIDTTNGVIWLYMGGAWRSPYTAGKAAAITWQ